MIKDGIDRLIRVVAGDRNVEIGEAVGVEAGAVELGEFFRVAGQRTVRGLGHPARYDFEGAIEPDGETVIGEQIAIFGFGEDTTAQGDNGGVALLDPVDVLANDAGLDAAELRLAADSKELGNGSLFGGFDLFVGVEEAPAEAVREVAADGGFAGRHEPDEIDAGSALEPEVHAV